MKDSAIKDKSYRFALRMVKAYKFLCDNKREMYYLNKCCEVEQQ